MEAGTLLPSNTEGVVLESETAAVPVDRCCLVVQMPSVEEMRREVADITCQMQSVYFKDGSPPIPTRSLTKALPDRSIDTSSDEDDLDHQRFHRNVTTLGSPLSKTHRSSRSSKRNNLESKSNTIDRMVGLKEKNLSEYIPSEAKMSSSLPREEQVSEEFVINGKLYRQTYQRKVVLERRTTRDVFFLPATTSDSGKHEGLSRSIEYTSPTFNQTEERYKHVEKQALKNDECRPRLDLTVVHNNSSLCDANCGITPTVVMRSSCGTPGNASTTPLSLKRALIFNEEGNIKSEKQSTLSSDASTVNSKLPKRSKSRLIVREVADALRKHLTANLRRSKSNAKTMVRVADTMDPSSSITNNLKTAAPGNPGTVVDTCLDMKKPPCCSIVGYMYQFGVWDEKAPVLDPRLPLARFDSSTGQQTVDKCGTVIANPPEWHHAEVGPNSSTTAQESLVRGRIVACLQRFTQHSLTSGKALHRSTYVQQTRLVRKRNHQKDLPSQKSIGDLQQRSTLDQMVKAKEAGQLKPPDSVGTMEVDTTFGSKDEEEVGPKTESGWFPTTAEFEQCCPDRLQILQSICPAAAAATILLGRQFLSKTLTDSDYDSTDEGVELGESCNGTRVLVNAKSWCPPALIAQDLSPYLLFNNNEEESKENAVPFRQEKPSDVPQLQIRGGTLDGLIAYTLRLLGRETQASQLDGLFPHVFRVTYSTFASPEKVIEKLIQAYVAYAPVEPGCQTLDWEEALGAARFLVDLAKDLHPEQLSARIVLRLARFTRLLLLDGSKAYAKQHPASVVKDCLPEDITEEQSEAATGFSVEHKFLADTLFDSLPLLSTSSKIRKRTSSCSKRIGGESQCNVTDSVLKEKGAHGNTHRVHRNSSDNAELLLPRKESKENCDKFSLLRQTSTDSTTRPDSHSTSGIHERIKRFLETDAQSIATEITRVEEEMFANIEFHEFLDISRLEKGDARTLGMCVDHFNRITRWARSLLFVVGPKMAEDESSQSKNNEASKPAINGVASAKSLTKEKEDSTSEPVALVQLSSTSSTNKSINTKSSPTHTIVRHICESQEKSRRNIYCLPAFSTRGPEHKVLRLKKLNVLNAIFGHLCEILKHLKMLKNFSSFLALLLAVQEVPESLLSRKSKSLFSAFSTYMKPPMFSEYRRDLETAELPCLPYLGLIFQQLIHLHVGNPVFLGEKEETDVKSKPEGQEAIFGKGPLGVMESSTPTTENMVNIWRCWKHYLILGYFIKRRENPQTSRHNLPKNTEIQHILKNFEDAVPDAILEQAKEQLIHPSKIKRAGHNRATS